MSNIDQATDITNLHIPAGALELILQKEDGDDCSVLEAIKNYDACRLFIDSVDLEEVKYIRRCYKEEGSMDELKRVYGVPPLECTYEECVAYKLNFGKYKGQTLEEVAKKDKQYVLWIAETGNPAYLSTWTARKYVATNEKMFTRFERDNKRKTYENKPTRDEAEKKRG